MRILWREVMEIEGIGARHGGREFKIHSFEGRGKDGKPNLRMSEVGRG